MSDQIRKPRSLLRGVVTKCSASKTVAVTVTNKVKDETFEKFVTTKRKYLVHDEKGECKVGDEVSIMETKPLSKLKRHRLLEIIKN